MHMDLKQTVLGLELGSTRIKAVLLDDKLKPIASGSYEWENQMVDGAWSYSMDDAISGMQACYKELAANVLQQYNTPLTTVGAIGISGMMHGYLPFDSNGVQLAAFRTWRNTITPEASRQLSALFDFNIPQRWSIAHLYQAMLNKEEHLPRIDYITTLAGYIHYLLTGERCVGLNEASGMFPINMKTLDYDQAMMEKFHDLAAPYGFPWELGSILPKALPAGVWAGELTPNGALLLDPTGTLQPGIPFAPPEGDMGTGMVSTNSVRVNTGNVSAGTSINAMMVIDKMPGAHKEIDIIATPDGFPAALVHCNSCTSDIDAWCGLFAEFAAASDIEISKTQLYSILFNQALKGDIDCGDMVAFNYYSGEVISGLGEGRPLFVRKPDSRFNLANFMRSHLFSALATLRIGMDILTDTEGIKIEHLYGHGGFFKTPEVGQRMLSMAAKVPVSTMETAGEGGAYGMALLAAYALWKEKNESLADFLQSKAFKDAISTVLTATEQEQAGFDAFLSRYKKALPIEQAAVEVLC